MTQQVTPFIETETEQRPSEQSDDVRLQLERDSADRDQSNTSIQEQHSLNSSPSSVGSHAASHSTRMVSATQTYLTDSITQTLRIYLTHIVMIDYQTLLFQRTARVREEFEQTVLIILALNVIYMYYIDHKFLLLLLRTIQTVRVCESNQSSLLLLVPNARHTSLI